MIDQPSDGEERLVLQAKQGDRNAYGELVARYYDSVIRVVYRLCGDTQVTQDAVQDAFIRAWLKLPEYQPRAPFRSWIYRIAINAAFDTLRRKQELSIDDENEGMLAMAEGKPGPEEAFIQKEEFDMVQKAVGALPEAARKVLVLREYGQLSYEDIATVLDIPVGTVMSRLNYARTHLRQTLQNYRLEMERTYV